MFIQKAYHNLLLAKTPSSYVISSRQSKVPYTASNFWSEVGGSEDGGEGVATAGSSTLCSLGGGRALLTISAVSTSSSSLSSSV